MRNSVIAGLTSPLFWSCTKSSIPPEPLPEEGREALCCHLSVFPAELLGTEGTLSFIPSLPYSGLKAYQVLRDSQLLSFYWEFSNTPLLIKVKTRPGIQDLIKVFTEENTSSFHQWVILHLFCY